MRVPSTAGKTTQRGSTAIPGSAPLFLVRASVSISHVQRLALELRRQDVRPGMQLYGLAACP